MRSGQQPRRTVRLSEVINAVQRIDGERSGGYIMLIGEVAMPRPLSVRLVSGIYDRILLVEDEPGAHSRADELQQLWMERQIGEPSPTFSK